MEEYTRGYNACNRKWIANIKDKIDEIEQEYFKILSNKNLSLEVQNINAHKHSAMRTVLEELLENEEGKEGYK